MREAVPRFALWRSLRPRSNGKPFSRTARRPASVAPQQQAEEEGWDINAFHDLIVDGVDQSNEGASS